MPRALLAFVMALILIAGARNMSGAAPGAGSGAAALAPDPALARWKLSVPETTGYNSCLSALASKTLKNGGPKTVFCACYIKEGAGDLRDSHKARAGQFLGVLADMAVSHQRGQSFGLTTNARDVEARLRQIITAESTNGLVEGTMQDLVFGIKQCIETAGDARPSRR